MLLHQGLEFGDELRATAASKVGVDPFFHCHLPALLEALRLRHGERLVPQVGESRPPPLSECRAQRRCGLPSSPPGERFTPLVEQALEAVEVKLLALDSQEITRGTTREPTVPRSEERRVGKGC